MENSYIDLHTHTTKSDGVYTPEQLCAKAEQAQIGVLAITDHNYTEDIDGLQARHPAIRLIQGAEISCLYTTSQKAEVEIHVVALGFDRCSPRIQEILFHNKPDRAPYINAILDRLRLCGIDLGSYEDLRRLYPDKRHIGRMVIAGMLKERHYVETVDRAFDVYIGQYGQRKAFVPNPLRYVSMEEAVGAILAAGGAAVLAHLYYYRLDETENERLLKQFKELAGSRGAMEVLYRQYDDNQRQTLKQLADRFDLMYSAASDYHGQSEQDSLLNHFPQDSCTRLLECLGL